MESQERTMRPIPKNVRQIGDLDGEFRLYVEDYVNTFIRKCARANRLVLGALVGDWYIQEGKEYLFVEGAVQADDYLVTDGRVQMTDEAWSGIYGKLGEFFRGKSICGWFLCGGETESCDVGMLRGFMYENLGREKRALIVCDAELEQEAFFVYDMDFIREQSGYYLFYERNEAMQSYMVTTSFAVRTDPVAVDAVTTTVRTRMVEKKELPVRRNTYPMMSAAALVIGVIVLAFGIVTLNHYEQLRDLEAALTSLTGNLLWSEETEGQTDGETKSGGLIIEDVEGGVSPSESDETKDALFGTVGNGESGDEVPGTAGNSEISGSASATGSGEDGSSASATVGSGEDGSPVSGTVGNGEPGNDVPETTAEGENNVPGAEGNHGVGAEVSGTDAAQPGDGNVSGSDKNGIGEGTQTNGETEANAAAYRTYLVESGETLVSICWAVYGYRDDEIIQQICEINQLIDKDHIYAGQELLIP